MGIPKQEIVIRVDGLSKTFKLPHEKTTSIKSALINFRKRRTYEKQEALKNISFEIKKGEFFGIVGRNGSGKSTLLKLLAGIYTPSQGAIQVIGQLTPFIELGVGFNHELTGRENVFLNGALLGFSRAQMDQMYTDIVKFAELERFMDQKLKNYSSGMQVRLAFSIAIRVDSDILLIDEVLAVGDAAFQKKCFEVFNKLKKRGTTIILVTHDMSNVERFCDRVLVIDNAKSLGIHDPHQAASIYAMLNVENSPKPTNDTTSVDNNHWGVGGVTIDNVQFTNDNKESATTFKNGEKLSINIRLKRDTDHKKTPVVCGLAFYNQDGHNLTGPNTLNQSVNTVGNEFTYTIKKITFAPGPYKLTVAIYDETVVSAFDFRDQSYEFNIISDHTVHGLIEIDGGWTS